MRTMSRSLLVLVSLLVLATAGIARAGEATDPSQEGAPGVSSQNQGGTMPGCPYANGGPCCGTCLEKQNRPAAPDAPAGGGCPCQERMRLKEKAAAAAEEKQ